MERTADAADSHDFASLESPAPLARPIRLLFIAGFFAAGLGALAFSAQGHAPWREALRLPLPPLASGETAPDTETENVTRIAGKAAAELYHLYVERGFVLDAAREGAEIVPRLIVERLPRDMGALDSSEFRKAVFIKTLLPLLLMENERILADRARLQDILAAGPDADAADREWVADLAERFGIEPSQPRELLRRVDAIPVSLAIAQAAIETGWGTSRVAQAGQALFGQMVFRNADDDGKVRKFEQLEHAVQAYAENLNTHRAYAEFRRAREQARRDNPNADLTAPDGYSLAQHLRRYSERGMDYVREVRSLMRVNGLRALDRAKLDTARAETANAG
jgi:Bax protein